MIYTVLKENDEYNAYLFNDFNEFTAALIERDNVNLECAIELNEVNGTYNEKKAAIEAKAIEYSNNQAGGLSYGEIADIQGYFETYGKRYGLLRNFREEDIC